MLTLGQLGEVYTEMLCAVLQLSSKIISKQEVFKNVPSHHTPCSVMGVEN